MRFMKSLSVVASVLVLVPLTLKGSDYNVSGVVGSGSGALQSSSVSTVNFVASEELGALEWLEAFEVSPEQLEADYQRTIGGGMAGETDNLITNLVRRALEGGELMIPVVFLAEAEEGEGKAEEGAEKGPGAEFNAALGARLTALELENAALKKRLAQLEPSADPVGPFVDPDWPPANVKPRRRFRFIPRQVQRGAPTRPIRPIVAVSPYPVRFRPFTRAAMDTQISGRLSRARGQSFTEQRRFFQNASKALGAGVASKEYRGVRLEVENAMLRGELNARYAVQYLADVVDVFRTYERLARFGLTDRVVPPVSADSFRRDPEFMFIWASEVKEQKRRLNREESLAR